MTTPTLCPACGAANPGGSRSCAICGGSLERVAMPLAEERKLVTVLFADIGQRRLFSRLHGELYDADYWKGLQATIRDGKVIDVFPYRRKAR